MSSEIAATSNNPQSITHHRAKVNKNSDKNGKRGIYFWAFADNSDGWLVVFCLKLKV